MSNVTVGAMLNVSVFDGILYEKAAVVTFFGQEVKVSLLWDA